VQPDWSVVYRFDTIANLQAWINSATRQDRLPAGRQYLDAPPTQQVIRGSAKAPDQLVTAVVTHRVNPADIDEFLRWQERLRVAETKFPGFRGSELFQPIDGVQNEWTALYRYDNAAALDAWLTSNERKSLLAEGSRFDDFHLRAVDNSFGSWFAFDEDGGHGSSPSNAKTSIAVWVGLYPTVVLLTLALSPLKMPLWLGMLIGNLLSSVLISFAIMPYYVNPLLKHWLRPPPGTSKRRTNVRGIAIIAAVMAAWTVIFYLVTTVFWHLP
jgi:antibiotic biosynthesis monooxygenase (ABM) superfamily enzyme